MKEIEFSDFKYKKEMKLFKKEDWRFDSLPRSNDCFEVEASIFKLVRIDDHSVRTYHCRVCGHSEEEAYTVNEMKLHCSDPRHSYRVQVLLDVKRKNSIEVDRRLAMTDKLIPRVAQLGSLVWQREMLSYFFQWVHAAGADPNPAFTETYELWNEALKVLKKYERMELSSLIELTAWKHCCLMAGTPESSYQMSSYLDMKEWESDGWKKNKAAMRRSEAIQVIVPNVLAFIDDNPLPTRTESTTTCTNSRKRRREES